MKTLNIEGKEYRKAGELAKELGYTSDYIGQLCRSGKVEAELVGRSWYVDPDSIINHKQKRYRSTITKSRQAIQREINSNATSKSSFSTREPSIHNLATRHITPTIYQEDAVELVPYTNKEKSTKPNFTKVVENSSEKSLKVKTSRSDEISMKAERLESEEPKFTGYLKISSLEEEGDFIDGLNEFPSDWVEIKKTENTKKVYKKRAKMVANNHIPSRSQEVTVVVARVSFIKVIYSSFLVIMFTSVLFLALLSLETRVVATQEGSRTSVGMNFESAASAVFSLKDIVFSAGSMN